MEENRRIEKVACVVNPDELYLVQHYRGGDTSGLITPYDFDKLKDWGYKLPQFKEHTIYTHHPFKKEYIVLDEQYADNMVLYRINQIEVILSYLGAKNFHVLDSSIKTNSKNTDTTVKANGEYNGIRKPKVEGGVDVGVHNSGNEGNFETTSVDTEWPGYYTIEGYQMACQIAKQSGLDKDSTIQSFLEERNPAHPNVILKKEYHIDVRSDLDSLRNVSVDVKAKVEKLLSANVSVGFQSKVEEHRHNTFDFEVEFGPLQLSKIDVSKYKENKSVGIKKKRTALYWVIAAVVVVGILLAILL